MIELFLNKLKAKTPDIKFDIYGVNKVQPIWADHYFKTISNAKMGLNSAGEAIKYYSSDRITQIVGNGLVCLIDEQTKYRDFFDTMKWLIKMKMIYQKKFLKFQEMKSLENQLLEKVKKNI